MEFSAVCRKEIFHVGVRKRRLNFGQNKGWRQKSGSCESLRHPVHQQSYRCDDTRYLAAVQIAELEPKAEPVAHDRSHRVEKSVRKAASVHLPMKPGWSQERKSCHLQLAWLDCIVSLSANAGLSNRDCFYRRESLSALGVYQRWKWSFKDEEHCKSLL